MTSSWTDTELDTTKLCLVAVEVGNISLMVPAFAFGVYTAFALKWKLKHFSIIDLSYGPVIFSAFSLQ